jgi:hypothetical protein
MSRSTDAWMAALWIASGWPCSVFAATGYLVELYNSVAIGGAERGWN